MMHYNDNDLEDLLFKSQATEQFGIYQFTCWDVKFDPSPESIIPEFISLHEYFHNQLNNSTLYGTVLHIYAHLAQNFDASTPYKAILAQLIRNCKMTHESYATYISFYIANRKGGSDFCLNPDEFLKDNLTYLNYYNIGKGLAPGFSKGHLSYCAVASVLRACMQGTAILHALINTNLNQFEPAQQLRWFEFPDKKLEQLKKIIIPEFWDNTLIAMQQEGKHLPGWDLIIAAEKDTALYELTLKPEFDTAIDFIELFFYNTIRSKLTELGVDTFEYNGHIEPTKMLVEKAEALLPRTKTRRTIITANDTHEKVEKLNVRDFENEKLIITPKPVTAILAKLAEIPTAHWNTLFAGTEPDEHFYLVSRLPFRMVQQFNFIEKDLIYLSSLNHVPLLYLQSSTVVEERIVEIFLIESPEQFEHLSLQISNNRPIVASLSMASLGNETWYHNWYDVIWKNTLPTVLMDISPFHHFDRWLSQDAFNIKYHSINCTIDDNNVYQVFACQPQTEQLNAIFLAPCSTIVNKSLFYYIENMIKNSARFVSDQAFITHQQNSWVLRVVLGHLFREEHYFDFSAGFNLNFKRKV